MIASLQPWPIVFVQRDGDGFKVIQCRCRASHASVAPGLTRLRCNPHEYVMLAEAPSGREEEALNDQFQHNTLLEAITEIDSLPAGAERDERIERFRRFPVFFSKLASGGDE